VIFQSQRDRNHTHKAPRFSPLIRLFLRLDGIQERGRPNFEGLSFLRRGQLAGGFFANPKLHRWRAAGRFIHRCRFLNGKNAGIVNWEKDIFT
jgi:hypothetical protein